MARVRRYRKARGVWDSTTAYSVGDYVLHDSGVYKCLIADTGTEPGTAPLTWDEIDEIDWPNKWSFLDADWVTYQIFQSLEGESLLLEDGESAFLEDGDTILVKE